MTWATPQQELAVAILARLTADTTLIGTGAYLAAGSIKQVFAGEGASFPYMLFRLADARNIDAMRTRSMELDAIFDIYIEEQPRASTAPTPFARGSQIITRVLGNWDEKSYGVAPDYGLDRWQPTLSNWTANPLEHTGTTEAHEPGVLHWIVNFKVRTHRSAA